jgi:hypothetical protein
MWRKVDLSQLMLCTSRDFHRLAKVRARVEYDVISIEQMGGRLIRTIGQARHDFGMTSMALCYNMSRLTYLKTAGMEAF